MGVPARTEGTALEARGVAGAFSALLETCSDAVLVFDGTRQVLLANGEACELFELSYDVLVGADVRELFSAVSGDVPAEGGMPFALEGTSVVRVRSLSATDPVVCTLRCRRIAGASDSYVLTAHASDAVRADARERDRLVAELTEANHRLAGTLQIVLDTIDATDIETLFVRVCSELANIMEADGVLLYVREDEVFRLRAHTEGQQLSPAAFELPISSGLGALLSQTHNSARLTVRTQTREALRTGQLTTRELVNEESREVAQIPAAQLPPFSSEMVVPLWFSGEVICAIELGWKLPHPMKIEDTRLLDAVVRYLSAQIMGAISALRERRVQELERAGQDLHDAWAARGHYDDTWRELFCRYLEENFGCRVVPADEEAPLACDMLPPADGDGAPTLEGALVASEEASRSYVVAFGPQSPLAASLADSDELQWGVYIDTGEIVIGQRWRLVGVRGADGGNMREVELASIRQVLATLHTLAVSGSHEEDTHISQALQQGMRNELQKVDGITAHGIYSSATAQAFVGGDFYDLIRLPHRRACVIMGDVSGKGIEAASVSAAVRTALGAYAWVGLDPAQMVRSLNKFLLGFSRLETFATLFVGIIDLKAARLSYCSAGHPPALVLTRSGSLEACEVQSGVVGAFPEMLYRTGTLALKQGDHLFLYTDGTTEARNPQDAFFGEDGLRKTLLAAYKKGAADLTAEVLSALDEFTERHLDDDVALVDLRFDEVGGQQ